MIYVQVKREFSDSTIEAFKEKYSISFDILKVPFNEGEGGEARQLKSASVKGMSDSFLRYSPGGKWMVFFAKSQSPYTEVFLRI